ncbi:2-amino-4-hydroxy-6-hydroxymethyldihydropteridine diphosphokinase [Mesonia maritima]|uniref:2-amino-4-hydroxy-6-hydroxymethyldihydropteridine pyrophosphokinase n=1 Tax=Mesonia maritima TaxID=1793873 RepID=A0ABU1K8E6_9FLAO|nr:2-amino-4-hydroxy-6-hydroxymethyldihydropteridine diphosphokinase [Mesonia maritima]MDR6301891.1 2-amino-4-hydroxy-6-hydroxymethyldihydropteridine diphosphokinase [Mesonia maritima]
MKNPVLTYIALGSNEGKKLENLQKALTYIFEKVGEISAVSNIYKTPALGFQGNEFLNACVEVKTRFSAQQTLNRLLEIEHILGRERSENGYQNRTIDLDIIYYAEEIIAEENLQIPHPHLANRKFVLQPLIDIASEKMHPKLQKNTLQLLKETNDDSPIDAISETLKIPQINLKNYNYLAIEGNIGAGKTSLAEMISQDFQAKLITERFKDNPFLPKFYNDQSRYAFPLEMSFLADRYQQLIDDISQYDLFSDFVVADYDVYKSLIFAEVTLQEEEFRLYKKLFSIMYNDLVKPDLYVYLYQNTDRLLENIQKRGRKYEQKIPPDYLEKINHGYLDFIKKQHHLNVKIIDISELDFVNRREDYLTVLEQLQS